MSTRTTKVYSITMPPEMGRQAEELAKRESRTMSELMREAFRRYQLAEAERRLLADPERPRRLAEFKRLMDELGAEAVRKGLNKITMRQIDREIAEVRKNRRASPARRSNKQPAA